MLNAINSLNLTGETALVSGASRGIGRAIAIALASAGAKVVGTAISQAGNDGGADGIDALFRENSWQGGGVVLDVTDSAQISAVLEQITAKFGTPSILINNAGITRDSLLVRMSDADWDAVINTNLNGAMRLTRACLRSMIKSRRGRIVNIASVVAATGNPGQTNYSATKAALLGFTKSLAREVAIRGITVNAVAPGFIDTEMTRNLPAAQREAMLNAIPLGRIGSVEDVANSVLFLVSPLAAYITGQTLHVNGGMYLS